MSRLIKVNVRSASEIELDKLEAFQGELKRLDREEYEKLRKTLDEDGISLSLHVWQNRGKNYLIDGHQRVAALKLMRDTEGFKVPKIPVSLVKAKDMKDARRKVLLAISQHGKLTDKSLHTYMAENGIDFHEVASTFNLPGIDVNKFMAKFANVDLVPKIDVVPASGDLKHGSDGVRQVQLFYNAEDHDEFMGKVTELAGQMELENISDALLVVVREAHKRSKKK